MRDIIVLAEDARYLLEAHKVTNTRKASWWIELIERPTGLTRIIYADTKKHAQAIFKGMSIAEVLAVYDKLGVKPIPLYKPNAYRKGNSLCR